MTHSAQCVEMVAQFEGLRLTAYQDQRGIWTIGYGHTANVEKGDICTFALATNWLDADLAETDYAVNELVHVPLNQNQFDALVSFTYNVGAGNFASSHLLRYLNEGNTELAAAQFPLWDHTNGVPDPGLERRRAAEQALFLKEAA